MSKLLSVAALFFLSFSVFVNSAKARSLPSATPVETLDEKRLGHEFLQVIWRSGLVVEDIEADIYLKNLGAELVRNSEKPAKHFDFYLLDDNEINAFAGFYGYIGLNTGLIMASKNEAEVAGVVAHEIAHVLQNHLQRFHEKSDKYGYLATAGILASFIVNNPEAAKALSASAVAGVKQQAINFTREHEWEADRIGGQILQKSGFSLDQAARFFERLAESGNHAEFLRTHPLNINRAADSLQRAQNADVPPRPDSFAYRTVRAKLHYHAHGRIVAGDRELSSYMRAYQAFDEQNYEAAKNRIAALILKKPSAPALILAMRIASRDGNLEMVENLAQRALALGENESVRYYLANAYFENKMFERGISVLRSFLKIHGGTAASYRLLGDLYTAKNAIDRAHFAHAKVAEKKGDLTTALSQSRRAQSVTADRDFYDVLKSHIETLEGRIELLEN